MFRYREREKPRPASAHREADYRTPPYSKHRGGSPVVEYGRTTVERSNGGIGVTEDDEEKHETLPEEGGRQDETDAEPTDDETDEDDDSDDSDES